MSTSSSIIGVDLGGTKIAVARFTADFSLEESRVLPTGAGRPFEQIVGDIIELVSALRLEGTVSIGMGVPGLVDRESGCIVRLPNIPGTERFDLRERIATTFNLPVSIANDAQCFALAEATSGAGRGESVVLGITIGTGIGGGVIIRGRILGGAHGFAGEVGHMLLVPGHPPRVGDDPRGDSEQFFSGTALRRRCKDALRPGDLLDGATCQFLHPDVEREVAWLAASLTHAFDPSVIVFGGSTGRALEPHLPKIMSLLPAWMLPGTPIPRLVLGSLVDAGTRGAAMLTKPDVFL